jgi:hypothetical protein
MEPPFAATPFTVLNSCIVSYCQSTWPSSVESARTTPSQPPEKTTPGIAVSAAVSPLRSAGSLGASIGVNHFLSPFDTCTAAIPAFKPK